MATGQDIQLARQIGEHLVTAELGRRGINATPFAVSVQDTDILAMANGVTVPVQVKAIRKDSWQFDIRKFLDINVGKRGQIVRGKNKGIDRKLVCIFVALGSELGQDGFYIFTMAWLQDYFFKTYKGRKPPKNIESFHCAIWKRGLTKHRDRWSVVEKRFLVKRK